MWGIFGKPLKRAIWNTLSLHAVLTVCLRFSSLLDDARVATMTTNRIRNNEWSLEHCLCPVCRPVYSSVRKTVTTYPRPPNPYISETAFSHRFRKAYTYPPPPPPQGNDILVH